MRVFFDPGDVVLRRLFQHHRLSRALLATVVRHDDSGLLLWAAKGATTQDMVMADGRAQHEVSFKELVTEPRLLTARPWRSDGLIWHPTDTPYSVKYFFEPAGQFTGWYVNLETPGVLWRDGLTGGIDSADWDLDIVVQPDRTWVYKDEDEMLDGVAHGPLYWGPDERTIRSAAGLAVKLVEAGEFPFDGTWTDFQPDPSWPVPLELPARWDRPRAF
jgi:predicted RNA-binding protein associated with RNAse of E/G family